MFRVAADEWDLPVSNPLDRLRLKVVDNKRQRRLLAGELDRLIAAAKSTKNPYTLLVVRFALETGMRRGEILALNWREVDLQRLSVSVLEAKNGHSRVIPLSSRAVAILQEARRLQDDQSASVFPMSANGFRLSWERLVKRANITGLHFHDLRHEAISRLFEYGLTAPEVASVSGHRDMRMLFRYAHANQTTVREKMSALDRV